MKETVFRDLDQYLSNLFSWEDEALRATLHSITKEKMPHHSISANQGQFLYLMAKLCNAKRIIEIGTLGGYSTIWLARALPDHGHITSIELNARYAEIARQNIKNASLDHKIEIRVGRAIDLLPELEKDERPVDLFFMDADKPSYINYFKRALKMCRKGALIIADNVIRQGKIIEPNNENEKVKGVKKYLHFLSENQDSETSVLQQVGEKGLDGIAISRVC